MQDGILSNNLQSFSLHKLPAEDFVPYDLPLPRTKDDLWGLLHEESPKNKPIFSYGAALSLFNVTSTFKPQSHFPLHLLHLGSLEALTDRKYVVDIKDKNNFQRNESLATVAYVQSSCDTPSERDDYVHELMKYIKVDSYGLCLHNKDLPESLREPMSQMMSEEFLTFLSKYKFILSLENAVCDYYMTEKLWRPLIIGSVPIYFGSPRVKVTNNQCITTSKNSCQELIPHPNSIILVQDFTTPKHLADYLLLLDANDTLYMSHLWHKEKGKVNNDRLVRDMMNRTWETAQEGYGTFVDDLECGVCDILHQLNDGIQSCYTAREDHYGCPSSITALTGEINTSGWWHEQWVTAKHEADILSKLSKQNVPYSAKDFYEHVGNLLMLQAFTSHVFTP